MGFDEAKNKTLEEIIKTEKNSNDWSSTHFMKLIDAKIGMEIKYNLYNVASCLDGVSKNISSSVDRLIASNKILSDANNRYAKALCWLTGGLVFVGLLQILK